MNKIFKVSLPLLVNILTIINLYSGVCDTVCSTNTAKKYFVSSGVSDVTSYTWSATNGITIVSTSGTLNDTVTVNFSTATPGFDTIKVTPTNSCGSGTQTSIVVFVQTTPGAPTISSNSPICSGNTLSLTAGGTLSGGTYSWSGPSGYTSSSQNPSILNANTSMSGTYSVFQTVNGCAGSSSSISVTVNQKPSAGVDQAGICGGSNTTLTGTTPNTGTWSALSSNPSGATLGSVTGGSVVVSFTTASSGSYSFIYNTTGNCTDTMLVSVTQKPNAGIDQTGICGGNNATLTGTSPSTGTWSALSSNPSGATLGATSGGIANVSFNSTAAGNYRFIYTSSGCTDTMLVSANSLPNAPVASDDTVVCIGSSRLLTVTGSTGASFSWTRPNSNVVSGNFINIATAALPDSGWYFVTQTISGCTSAKDSVLLTVVTPPAITSGSIVSPTSCGATNGSFVLSGLKPSTSYFVSYTGPPSASNASMTSTSSGTITITGLSTGNYTNINVKTGIGFCTSNNIAVVAISGPKPTGSPVIQCK